MVYDEKIPKAPNANKKTGRSIFIIHKMVSLIKMYLVCLRAINRLSWREDSRKKKVNIIKIIINITLERINNRAGENNSIFARNINDRIIEIRLQVVKHELIISLASSFAPDRNLMIPIPKPRHEKLARRVAAEIIAEANPICVGL